MTDHRDVMARAICEGRCFRGEVMDKPCINTDLSNGTCRATVEQLVLTGKLSTAAAVLKAIEDAGFVMVEAKYLMDCHDAFTTGNHTEAYHQLRMAADEDCSVYLKHADHFYKWKQAITDKKGQPE